MNGKGFMLRQLEKALQGSTFTMADMESQKKVLIIDDDIDWVEANKIVLEANSYKVFTAYNGDQGIVRFFETLPDLIILDISMEKRDEGFYVCHKIRSYPRIGNVPVIMITALHQSTKFRFSPETDGEYLPADELIDKPVDPLTLLQLVNKWLEK